MLARRLQPQWEPRIVVSEHRISPLHSGSAGSRGRGGRSEGWRRLAAVAPRIRTIHTRHQPHSHRLPRGGPARGVGPCTLRGRGIADGEGNRGRASPACPELRRGWTVVGSEVAEATAGPIPRAHHLAPPPTLGHNTRVTPPRISARRQSRETQCADQGGRRRRLRPPKSNLAGGLGVATPATPERRWWVEWVGLRRARRLTGLQLERCAPLWTTVLHCVGAPDCWNVAPGFLRASWLPQSWVDGESRVCWGRVGRALGAPDRGCRTTRWAVDALYLV